MLIGIIGCQSPSPKTPQEVARLFWDAIEAMDIDNARKYTTVESRGSIDLSNEQLNDVIVNFGKIIIDGNATTIESTLQKRSESVETPTTFQTILKQQDGIWVVDYEQTRNTIPEASSVVEIAEDLRELGEDFSKNVEEGLSELKKEIPEIEKKVIEYGDEASKNIEESIRQHIPEIKKGIEEFGIALGEDIEDIWQQNIPAIKKSIEDLGKVLNEVLKDDVKDENKESEQEGENSKTPDSKRSF